MADKLVLNIGLKGPRDISAEANRLATWYRFAKNHNAESILLMDSATEPTLVVSFTVYRQMARVNLGMALRLACLTEQDCIAVFDTSAQCGFLLGPKASQWQGFDPRQFIMPDGRFLKV